MTSETDVGVSLQSYSATTFSWWSSVNSFNILISFVSSICDLVIFFLVILLMATVKLCLCKLANDSFELEYLSNLHEDSHHFTTWIFEFVQINRNKWKKVHRNKQKREKALNRNIFTYSAMASFENNSKSTMSNQISCIVFVIADMNDTAIRMRIHDCLFRTLFLFTITNCMFVSSLPSQHLEATISLVRLDQHNSTLSLQRRLLGIDFL